MRSSVRRKFIRRTVEKILDSTEPQFPPINVYQIAENLGISVVKTSADDDLSGFLLRDTGMEFDAFSNFGQVMFGIDVSCVQCHDDMLDQTDMTQMDFYRMAAFFGNTQRTIAVQKTEENMKIVQGYLGENPSLPMSAEKLREALAMAKANRQLEDEQREALNIQEDIKQEKSLDNGVIIKVEPDQDNITKIVRVVAEGKTIAQLKSTQPNDKLLMPPPTNNKIDSKERKEPPLQEQAEQPRSDTPASVASSSQSSYAQVVMAGEEAFVLSSKKTKKKATRKRKGGKTNKPQPPPLSVQTRAEKKMEQNQRPSSALSNKSMESASSNQYSVLEDESEEEVKDPNENLADDSVKDTGDSKATSKDPIDAKSTDTKEMKPAKDTESDTVMEGTAKQTESSISDKVSHADNVKQNDVSDADMEAVKSDTILAGQGSHIPKDPKTSEGQDFQ